MKKIDLGQTITIFANIGVITGIVFLAFELQQNNDQLSSQTRANLYSMQADVQRDVFTNVGGITDVLTKAREGQDLTASESARVAAFRGYTLRTIEFMFREDPEGSRESARWFLVVFRSVPDVKEYWDEVRSGLDPDFVRFIEENVISQLEP